MPLRLIHRRSEAMELAGRLAPRRKAKSARTTCAEQFARNQLTIRLAILLQNAFPPTLRSFPGSHPSIETCRTFKDRKSVVSGKSVSVRVYLGGRRVIKKNK